jgi:ABC-2 type transport system permease protein
MNASVSRSTERPAFLAAAAAERVKLTSLTGIRIAFLAVVLVVPVGITIFPVSGPFAAGPSLLGALSLAGTILAVVGVVSGSSEYTARTIQPSLLAVPRRGRLLVAKALVLGVCGAVLFLVGALPLLVAAWTLVGMAVRSAVGGVLVLLFLFVLVPLAVLVGVPGFAELTLTGGLEGVLLAADARTAFLSLSVVAAWSAPIGILAPARLLLRDA